MVCSMCRGLILCSRGFAERPGSLPYRTPLPEDTASLFLPTRKSCPLWTAQTHLSSQPYLDGLCPLAHPPLMPCWAWLFRTDTKESENVLPRPTARPYPTCLAPECLKPRADGAKDRQNLGQVRGLGHPQQVAES